MRAASKRRLSNTRAPHKIKWSADDGSIVTANRIFEIAAALNREPRFTAAENDMADAIVKTFNRDYVSGSICFPTCEPSFNSVAGSTQENL
ncbi:hypothetical protein [Bradyrhizobium macuxiense]|uniref:hypothetical protein n=1 Tax=Bradyrhizobium macuxiense TaxID=1755647 RepID=UPI0011BEA209|nr:hypothetical protein [Bradyrhizobium macuxiense]